MRRRRRRIQVVPVGGLAAAVVGQLPWRRGWRRWGLGCRLVVWLDKEELGRARGRQVDLRRTYEWILLLWVEVHGYLQSICLWILIIPSILASQAAVV